MTHPRAGRPRERVLTMRGIGKRFGAVKALTDVDFWQWAAPVLAGLVFAAGPIFNMIRRRDTGVVGTDETPG